MDLSPEMQRELNKRLDALARVNEKDPAHEILPGIDRVMLAVLFFGSLLIIAYKSLGL